MEYNSISVISNIVKAISKLKATEAFIKSSLYNNKVIKFSVKILYIN